MTRAEVVKLVALAVASWSRAEVRDETVAIYEAELMDLAPAVLAEAISRLRRTSKWFPSIAEIRAAAVDVALGPQRTGEEAWEDVTKAIRFVGVYDRPTFGDPIVAECVEAMGWRALCLEGSDVTDRSRFCAMYAAKQARARADLQAGKPLPPARGYPRLKQPEEPKGNEGGNVRSLLGRIGNGGKKR